MLFLQASIPDVNVTSNVFGISPTTVYGVLAGLLFLAVAVLGRLYIKSHDRLVASKEDELKKAQESVAQLVSENRELHNKLYEMGLNNIKTLEKFGALLESFLSENKATQRELLASIKELTDNIRHSLEFSRQMVEQNAKRQS